MSLKLVSKLQDVSNSSNEQEFKNNLPLASNDKLCEIIVCFRYLGLMEEEAILSMQELADRREAGDVYEYEEKILSIMKNLPQINLDINKILKSFRL